MESPQRRMHDEAAGFRMKRHVLKRAPPASESTTAAARTPDSRASSERGGRNRATTAAARTTAADTTTAAARGGRTTAAAADTATTAPARGANTASTAAAAASSNAAAATTNARGAAAAASSSSAASVSASANASSSASGVSSGASASASAGAANANSTTGGSSNTGVIVAVVVVVVVVIAALIGFFLWRKRRNSAGGVGGRRGKEDDDVFGTLGPKGDSRYVGAPDQYNEKDSYGMNNSQSSLGGFNANANNHPSSVDLVSSAAPPGQYAISNPNNLPSSPSAYSPNGGGRRSWEMSDDGNRSFGQGSEQGLMGAAAGMANRSQHESSQLGSEGGMFDQSHQSQYSNPASNGQQLQTLHEEELPTAGLVGNPANGQIFTVKRSFEPSLGDELIIVPGDKLRLLMTYDDGWALAENLTAPRQPNEPPPRGVFPRDCLDERPDSIPSAPSNGNNFAPGPNAGYGMPEADPYQQQQQQLQQKPQLTRVPTLPPLQLGDLGSSSNNNLYDPSQGNNLVTPAIQVSSPTHTSPVDDLSSNSHHLAYAQNGPSSQQPRILTPQQQNMQQQQQQVVQKNKRTSSLIASSHAQLVVALGEVLDRGEGSK